MDQRYYTSLLILLLLIMFAWAIGPASNSEPANDQSLVAVGSQNAQSESARTGFFNSNPPNADSQPAVPMAGGNKNASLSASIAAIQLSQNLSQPSYGNTRESIPHRLDHSEAQQTSPGTSPGTSMRSTISSAGFHKPTLGQLTATNDPPGTSPTVSFSMPNTQPPTDPTLPNGKPDGSDRNNGRSIPGSLLRNRLVLKPIVRKSDRGQDTVVPNYAANFKTPVAAVNSGSPVPPQPVRPMPGVDATTESAFGDPLFQQMSQTLRNDQRSLQTDLAPKASIRKSGTSSSYPSTLGQSPTLDPSTPREKGRGRPSREYIWHVVGERQTLEGISLQYVGNASIAQGILELNTDIIQDPNLLPVGKAIRIPVQ